MTYKGMFTNRLACTFQVEIALTMFMFKMCSNKQGSGNGEMISEKFCRKLFGNDCIHE